MRFSGTLQCAFVTIEHKPPERLEPFCPLLRWSDDLDSVRCFFFVANRHAREISSIASLLPTTNIDKMIGFFFRRESTTVAFSYDLYIFCNFIGITSISHIFMAIASHRAYETTSSAIPFLICLVENQIVFVNIQIDFCRSPIENRITTVLPFVFFAV